MENLLNGCCNKIIRHRPISLAKLPPIFVIERHKTATYKSPRVKVVTHLTLPKGGICCLNYAMDAGNTSPRRTIDGKYHTQRNVSLAE